MVKVRSTHLSIVKELTPEQWIASLSIVDPRSSMHLKAAWHYFDARTHNHPQKYELLSRGTEMAEILTMLGMDSDSLCAALIFPLFEVKIIEEIDFVFNYGKDTSKLIYGIFLIDNAIDQIKSSKMEAVVNQGERIRQSLLTVVEDLRCIIIKMAERIVSLREMKNYSKGERTVAAKECLDIYVPIANRLGIGQLKWELEDYCFRYLYPDEYKEIAELLQERRIDREQYIEDFINILNEEMVKEEVRVEIYGRPKHIYSIWLKMQKKSLAFNKLFDVLAVRIVAERLQDCYGALRVAHTLYRYLPNEFDDYITHPKPNGYQSIHTVVLGPDDKKVEIQIRTRQMHEHAELGIAAHWRYKEDNTAGKVSRSFFQESIGLLHELN